MPRPIIALLTDFGTRDHYSGVMKGVILGICPDVTLVDVTHDLPPHDIAFAAHELAATYRHFPAGTIFLVVVDPGVGTARRGIAAEAADRKFIAPDNGVLTAVFQEAPPKRVVELSERRYAQAHREPHVRRARSIRAGGGVHRQGHSSRSVRPVRDGLPAAQPAGAGGARRLRSAAAWSASIDSATSSPIWTGDRARSSAREAPGSGCAWPARHWPARSRRTPTSSRVKSARCSAARIISSARSWRRARPGGWACLLATRLRSSGPRKRHG